MHRSTLGCAYKVPVDSIKLWIKSKSEMSPDLVTQLKGAGIQPSAQRLAVAEYVLGTDQHPSADEVLAQVQASRLRSIHAVFS